MVEEKRYSPWEYDEDAGDQDDEQQDQDQEEEQEDQGGDSDDQDDSGKAGDDKSTEKQTVKLDDGSEITLDELKKGYMRQSDYTKKTQELSQKVQNLSPKEQADAAEKAKEVMENKDEYPADDVKAAEYIFKILKDKFGLLTKEELEQERTAEKQKEELDGQFTKVGDMAKDLGIKWDGSQKSQDRMDLIEFMKENQIYNAVVAFKAMKEDDIFDAKMKKATSSKKNYESEEDGEKDKGDKKKGKKKNMDQLLDEELEKMDTESVPE